jgi:hypothetical protein
MMLTVLPPTSCPSFRPAASGHTCLSNHGIVYGQPMFGLTHLCDLAPTWLVYGYRTYYRCLYVATVKKRWPSVGGNATKTAQQHAQHQSSREFKHQVVLTVSATFVYVNTSVQVCHLFLSNNRDLPVRACRHHLQLGFICINRKTVFCCRSCMAYIETSLVI